MQQTSNSKHDKDRLCNKYEKSTKIETDGQRPAIQYALSDAKRNGCCCFPTHIKSDDKLTFLFHGKPETRKQPSPTLAGLVVWAVESAINVRVHGVQRGIDPISIVKISIEI